MYYVYILQCSDNSLYTGITPNLQQRMRQHLGLLKGGARYTKLRPPKEIAAVWTVPDKVSAAKAEYAIKHLTPAQKRQLVASPAQINEILNRPEPLELTVYPTAPLAELIESKTNSPLSHSDDGGRDI